MSFSPIQRQRVSEQIADQLRDAIIRGDYAPGDRLPAERVLALDFQVNRSTVREALQRLEAHGLVKMRHGGGTIVQDFLASSGLQLLPFLVAPGGVLDGDMLGDLLDIRVMIMEWTAGRAALRSTPQGVAALRTSLDELRSAADPASRQSADLAFFEQLVRMTNNRVLTLLSGVFRRAYTQNAELFLALYMDGIFSVSQHVRVLAAVEASDARAARQAMGEYARSVIPGGGQR